MNRAKAFGWTVSLLLLTAAGVSAPATPASAEIIGPGTYRGTYAVDRWSQGRFGFLFVAEALDETLKDYAGVPLALEATGVNQPMNPGGAMITKVGKITKLTSPVAMAIAWQEPAKGPTEALRRIAAGGEIKLRITMTNRSGGDLVLRDQSLYLAFDFHHPSGAGTSDAMGYWSQHNSLLLWEGESERILSICEAKANLLPADQVLDAAALTASSPGPRPEEAPVLADGKSHSWTVTVRNVPTNEFEITAVHSTYDREAEAYIHTISNVLRLDVLAAEAVAWQGLEVHLRRAADRGTAEDGWVPLEMVFTNTGQKPLRFAFQTRGGKRDLANALLCYDRRGTALAVPAPKGKWGAEYVRVEPGKDCVVPVDAPRGTAFARLAFHHRVVVQNAKADETPLGNGYVFSPLLDLTENAGAGVLTERPKP